MKMLISVSCINISNNNKENVISVLGLGHCLIYKPEKLTFDLRSSRLGLMLKVNLDMILTSLP